jgi:hypothetical protein
MKFTLIVEVSDADIEQYAYESDTFIGDAEKEITNTMYLGLSCIDGMLARQFEITNVDSYVEKGVE